MRFLSTVSLLGLVAAPLASAAVSPSKVDNVSRRDIDIQLDICISVDLNLGGLLEGLLWEGRHPGGTCSDLSKIDTCYRQGHACDEHCVCIPPPPHYCSDQCAILKCQSQGQATNSDCSCKKTCDCQDQFDCWKKGGKLDSHCHCVVPTKGWGKRDLTVRTPGVCSADQTACRITGSTNGFDCLDVTSSMESCGGCVSEGKGTDCSAIEGVVDVSCLSGSCAVQSCASGYKVSPDGASCDSVDVGAPSNQQIFVGSLKGVEKFWGM